MNKYHFMQRRLDKVIQENPSASWANEWIDCLACACSCKKCIASLKANDADLEMLKRIFGKASVKRRLF